jgi:beta-carotene 3-hydroxylase
MIIFTMFLFLGLIGMEIFSYLIHRFLFHGILWPIHKSHHISGHHNFELNDLFSIFFALISIGLIFTGGSWAMPLGLGIAIYGVLYFIIHDILIHKRFLRIKTGNRVVNNIKHEHQIHHQVVDKKGKEPYGLFVFMKPTDNSRINNVNL